MTSTPFWTSSTVRPAARIAHPRTEHFAPLFVSLGATADTWQDAHSAVDGFWYGMAKRSFEI